MKIDVHSHIFDQRYRDNFFDVEHRLRVIEAEKWSRPVKLSGAKVD